MKRVTSRQRLVSWDTFDASFINDDDDSSLSSSSEGSSSDRRALQHFIDTKILGLNPRETPRKRSRECNRSSSICKPAQTPASVVPSNNKSTVVMGGLEFQDLFDDVQLHIISFLTQQDARSILATSHKLRSLLQSKEALYLWTQWCRHQWPVLNKSDKLTFRDDFFLSTALGSFQNSLQANLSVLLSMASRTHPTNIHEASLLWEPRTLFPTERHCAFRSFEQDGLPVVQFVGAVGTGDRSIRSNHPLPRPRRVKPKTRKCSSGSSFSLDKEEQDNNKRPYFRDMICRGSRSRRVWQPFVAPYMSHPSTPKEQDQHVEVHLTPRLVSYYEVSVLKRDESQEPSPPLVMDGHNQRASSVTECVAVGLSFNFFRFRTRMPGWDCYSFGYHGDDGGIFHSSGSAFRRFGPRFGAGDTIGCGVDYVCGGIFYTLNGKFLGYGWTGLDVTFLQYDGLYPTVGVDTNCPVACNFGERPFCFDLTPLVKHHQDVVEGCLGPLATTTANHTSVSSPSRSQRYFRRPKVFRSQTKKA